MKTIVQGSKTNQSSATQGVELKMAMTLISLAESIQEEYYLRQKDQSLEIDVLAVMNSVLTILQENNVLKRKYVIVQKEPKF